MKKLYIHLLLMLICGAAAGQTDFTGIAKYRLSTDGGGNNRTDSMSVIFDKLRVRVTLYLPDLKNPKVVSEMIFIDDFKNKKSITVNQKNKTYKIDSLNTSSKYLFNNTRKVEASYINALCFHYKADTAKLDRSKIFRVDCLGSIDNMNYSVKEYFFLGVQPVIIDNRLVMEFLVTHNDGIKGRTSVSELINMENVDSYFDLKGYKQEK